MWNEVQIWRSNILIYVRAFYRLPERVLSSYKIFFVFKINSVYPNFIQKIKNIKEFKSVTATLH